MLYTIPGRQDDRPRLIYIDFCSRSYFVVVEVKKLIILKDRYILQIKLDIFLGIKIHFDFLYLLNKMGVDKE